MLVKKNLTSKHRPVSTPGEDTNENVNEPELSEPAESKSFRAHAARGNYLSIVRPDLQFSAKEISRAMSRPPKKHQRKIVRMAEYLKDPEKSKSTARIAV